MKTKKFLSVLLTMVMIISLLPTFALIANAETGEQIPADTWHNYMEDSFDSGEGTSENPYIIKTAGQLAKLSNDVMLGTSYKDTYFKLDEDIDLSEHRWIPIGVHKWEPSETVNKPFCGSFDGNSKTISNMYIDSAADGNYYSGFFGSISNYLATNSPVIKDLIIDNATVNYNAENQEDCISGIFAGRIGGNAEPRVQISNINISNSTLINTAINDYGAYQGGAFAGYLDYALIQNCHTQNIVITGGANNGGFVGLTSNATFENCSAKGSISGSWGLGGFVGNAVDSASFTKCTADVDITANNWNLGGFCGYATYGVEFDKCVAYGDVQSVVTGFEPKMGGFAGTLAYTFYDDIGAASSMTNCYYAGTLTSAHETIKPSGLVALVEDSTITNCAYDGVLNADIVGYTGETSITALTTSELKFEICENVIEHNTQDGVCSNCGYAEYDVYINGIQVTSINADDVLGSADDGATVTYDAQMQKLTLNNATITVPSSVSRKAGIYIDNITDAVEIELIGENYITLTDTAYDCNGIWNDSTADLKISGNGSLNITIYNDYSPFGIWNRNSDVTLENSDITVNLADGSTSNGYLFDCNHVITVDGASIAADGFLQGLFAEDDVVIKNGANIDIDVIETAIYSGKNILIDAQSVVDVKATDTAGICAWGNISIINSNVTAESEYNNGIYCYGSITVSGGELNCKSIDFDAFQGIGGIKIENNAVVTAESDSGAGIYTGEIFEVSSGTVTATGAAKAIVARRISDSASDSKPTESPDAIKLGSNMIEESGATVKTEDWVYTTVWDDYVWDSLHKWRSLSYFVDQSDTAVLTVKIIAKPQPPSGGGGGSSTTTTTTKNDDGSTTKTTTNKRTGTVTETTTNPDGSSTKVETKKDGTVTTTEKDKEGNTTTTVENPDGTSTTTEKLADGTTTVTEKEADGTTTTTETDKAGNKTVTTENTDGSSVTEETKKDGTKVVTETTADGKISSEITVPNNKETEVVIPVENADEVTKVVVTDKDGKETEVEFEAKDGGVAISVSGNSTVRVQTGHICYAKDFDDVDLAAWYHENVCYALGKGLMKGVADDKFAPNDSLTRAMLVTILYRAEGEPATNGKLSFADVEMGSWYANAVTWAQQNEIVKGISETAFAPDNNITREQIAAILYRYAIYKGMDAVNLSENLGFADADEISSHAISAMNWAVGTGLIKGYENNTVRPQSNATRAEAAALLQRFLEANK